MRFIAEQKINVDKVILLNYSGCPTGSILCPNTSDCIENTRACDGISDCMDGCDESVGACGK